MEDRVRGPLAIHASKNTLEAEYSGIAINGPFGAIIAVVELVDCLSTKFLTMFREDDIAAELNIGDFSPDRWGWELRNVTLLDTDLHPGLSRPVGVQRRHAMT